MKKLLSLFIILSIVVNLSAQSDTVQVKASWYGRVMPVSLYTGFGYMPDKISQNIEFGRSIGVIDVGLSYGRISLRPDSTQFVEAKVTMDACQIGIFSNEFTVGVGTVFNSKTPIMLELSSTIFAQVGTNWGVGVVTGYYDFSGNNYDFNKNYFGLYARIGLLRNDGGMLMNRKVHIHPHTHHHHHR